MKRMRILGLALVAVFALGALVAGSASAKPEIGRCVAVSPGTGKYTDANCTKKAKPVGTGDHNFVKGLVKRGFKATTGEAFLEGASGIKVVCSSSVATGTIEKSGKGAEKVSSVYSGCGIPAFGLTCNSPGKSAGTIETFMLKGKLGYINKKSKPKQVGGELRPETGTVFAEFECTSAVFISVHEGKEKGGNCIINHQYPINEMKLSGTSEYKTKESKPGVQDPQHFENLKPPICNLESEKNHEGEAGQERSSQNQTGPITLEEEGELFA